MYCRTIVLVVLVALVPCSVIAEHTQHPRTYNTLIQPPGLSMIVRPRITDDGTPIPKDIESYSCTSLDGPDCSMYQTASVSRDVALELAQALDIDKLLELDPNDVEAVNQALLLLFDLSLEDLMDTISSKTEDEILSDVSDEMHGILLELGMSEDELNELIEASEYQFSDQDIVEAFNALFPEGESERIEEDLS